MTTVSKKKANPPAAIYIDHDRDFRDVVLRGAICGAIQLIDDGEQQKAAEVLRLAVWNLEASWPVTDKKFTAEVANV
jgi:hypothetical protein